jgi:hypothetical protein
MMAWESVEQWHETLLHLLSPKAAVVHRVVVFPFLAPVASIRRSLSARFYKLSARQTHPRQPLPVAT